MHWLIIRLINYFHLDRSLGLGYRGCCYWLCPPVRIWLREYLGPTFHPCSCHRCRCRRSRPWLERKSLAAAPNSCLGCFCMIVSLMWSSCRHNPPVQSKWADCSAWSHLRTFYHLGNQMLRCCPSWLHFGSNCRHPATWPP